MDIFDEKDVKPMLIGADAEAFDDPDFLYELKLDGERAIVYLDPKHGTELRNKRNKRMLPIFPELSELHRQAKGRCILDGEYIVLKDGKPNFSEVQRRSLMSNPFKIRLAADKLPASFVAFDILYLDGAQLTGLPLTERKDILRGTVSESGRMAVSRVVERGGVELYKLTERAGLEGIVAKRRDSRYYLDKRTKDWIKCKNLLDDDFVVCGYIRKSDHMTSIVLGQYDGPALVYKGHVTLGVSGEDFRRIEAHNTVAAPAMEVPAGHGNEQAEWITPDLVCTVKFMERTANGGMRQPVFKGLRDDKAAHECKVVK
ncbi:MULTISPECIES: RNA ligase family protein [Anaerotruncus]|uniref:ATP-dependent DNA ligase n=1 Tax=Anaerotruncus TaxID=244127 RepID=UPI000C78C80B|nr:RNA ligase family protein [Anaerotruncus massiliensis (ex Togo et al. 2019)]